MESQNLQQLIQAISNLNNEISHLRGDISQMNTRITSLSDSTLRNTASIESLTAQTSEVATGHPQANEKAKEYLSTLSELLLEVSEAAHKKTGDKGINKHKMNAAEKVAGSYEKDLTDRLDMLMVAWNRDHPNSNLEPHQEVGLRAILQEAGVNIAQAIGSTQEELEEVLEAINLGRSTNNSAVVNLDDNYKRIKDNAGKDVYLSISSDFSKARDDIKLFSDAVSSLRNDIKSSNDTINLTNDIMLDLATNSDTVNKIMSDLNTSMTVARDNMDIFSTLLTSAGNAQWNQEEQIKKSTQAMGHMQTVMQQMEESMTSLANANANALRDIREASISGSSKNNSFREQATRNSDRAKQAGFIALLIPALAKLLKKSPMTDLLKLLFLRLGATHPMLAAAGLMASPFITGTILAPAAQKMLSGIFGVGGHLKGVRNVRAPRTGGGLPLSQSFKYAHGYYMGVTSGRFDRVGANIDRVAFKLGDFKKDREGNFLYDKYGRRIITSHEGNVAGGLGYEQGRQWARNMRRIWQPKFLLPRFGRVVGNNLKNMTRGVPLLGTAIGAMFELPDIINAGKSGRKGALASQLGKSTGGVAGGTLGAALGGAIGTILGPIGTIVGATLGGIIGDKAGRTVGPFLAKGFKGTFDGLKKYLDSLGKHLSEFGLSIGKVGTAIGHVLSPIVHWVSKFISLGLNATLKVTLGLVDGIVIALTKLCDGISWVCEQIAKSLTSLEIAILNSPLVGPALRAVVGSTPGGKDKLNELASQSAPDTALYNDRKKELVAQYYRVNSPSISGVAKNMVEAYQGGSGIKGMFKAGKNALGDWKNINQNANDWAEKQLQQQGTAIRTNKVYNTLPTKEIHGVRAVALRSLGLYGGINPTENSIPYIAANNAGKVQTLDTYLHSKGYKFRYSSAMGGGHAGGPRSHGAGQKVDLVIENNGGKLNAADERWLRNNGFYGRGTGAVGYHNAGSGWHYDLSVSSGIAMAAKEIARNTTITNNKTVTETAELGSGIREAFRELVGGGKGGSSKQDRTRNIVLSAVDVTGSLGVWGITQYNNGVMSK